MVWPFDDKPANNKPADLTGLTAQVTTLAKSVETMAAGMGEIKTAVTTLHQNQTNMQEGMNSMQQNMNAGNDHQLQHDVNLQAPQAPKSIAEYTPEELETLTEAQKMQIMQESIQFTMQAEMKTAMDPLGKQLSEMNQNTANFQQQTALDKLMTELGPDQKLLRPDFKEMMQTMVDLKKDPSRTNLPLSDLYELSRSHYKKTRPEEFAALQDKHFPKPDVVQDPYGGFLSDTMQETDEPGNLSLEDAGNEAAKQVLENQGGLPSADSSTLLS